MVLVCCAITFAFVYRDAFRDVPFLFGVVTSALIGAVVASHRPHNPIGWFFVGSAASFAISGATSAYADYGLRFAPAHCRWLMRWLGRLAGCGCLGLR